MKLTDESKIPFGKHKGKELQDVPGDYLIWLEGDLMKDNDKTPFAKALLEYIEDNRDVIEQEAKRD